MNRVETVLQQWQQLLPVLLLCVLVLLVAIVAVLVKVLLRTQSFLLEYCGGREKPETETSDTWIPNNEQDLWPNVVHPLFQRGVCML